MRTLTGIGLALIAVWLCIRIQPAIALWWELLTTFDRLDIGSLRSRYETSGLALAPVAAVLTVPTLQAMSVVAFVLGSVASLVLLIVRSACFARVLIACTLMQGALVFASASGTAPAQRGALSVSVAIHEMRSREELIERRALEQVERYRQVTAATTTTLVWTWAACGLLTSYEILVPRQARAWPGERRASAPPRNDRGS